MRKTIDIFVKTRQMEVKREDLNIEKKDNEKREENLWIDIHKCEKIVEVRREYVDRHPQV